MTREIVSSCNASDPPEPLYSQELIAPMGDVFIVIKDPRTDFDVRYLCSRAVLREHSEYFNALLDSTKFSEGRAVEAKLQELATEYSDYFSTPASKLPTVAVSDVCQLPKAADQTASTVIKLFLDILHPLHTPWPKSRLEPINVVALLAILADRLGAVNTVRGYLRSQHIDHTLLKDRKTCTAYQLEIDNRQRLLAGMVFDFPPWVREYSAALILAGSKRQVTTNLEPGAHEEADEHALWWRLPNGVEGMYMLVLKCHNCNKAVAFYYNYEAAALLGFWRHS